MSAKNVDKHNRLRSVTVKFRMSPQESKQLNTAVTLTKKLNVTAGQLLNEYGISYETFRKRDGRFIKLTLEQG